MRTTNKQFKEQVQAHIIECTPEEELFLKDELQNAVDGFNNYYQGDEQKRQPNKYLAFRDWLLGLPSELSPEYTYYNIHQTLKSWFEACGQEYKDREPDQETDLYLHLITREFQTLCKKNGVEF